MVSRKTNERLSFAAVLVTLAALPVLWVLVHLVQNVGNISSQEVDDILYQRLDEYNRTILDDPDVALLVTIAETNPDDLTSINRQKYLAYQRTFFDGWEAAWNYNDAGHFDADRWTTWNSWYIRESRRRPEFGWSDNRKYYTGEFLKHVDDSLHGHRSKSSTQSID